MAEVEDKVDLVDQIFGATPEEQVEQEEQPAEQETVQEEEAVKEEAPVKEQKEERMIPHGALHEERERRKELQKALETERQERQRMEERFTKMLQTVQPQAEQEYKDPLEKINEDVAEVKSKLNNEIDNAKREREEHDFLSKYRNSTMAYMQENPEYNPNDPNGAYAHLLNAQKKLLSKAFSGEKLAQRLAAYERDIVQTAYENERNPAEVLYEMAVESGYKKPQPQQPVKTIKKIEKDISAAKSLSVGGQPDSGGGIESMSPTEINALSQDEFDKLWRDLEKRTAKR